MEGLWSVLLDILTVLVVAVLFGALCERLRQSAIVGYLLAGTLVGPHALNLIANEQVVSVLAELGVAMLLFSIGLQFSWRRLRSLGATSAIIGVLQIIVTIALVAAVAVLTGQPIALAVTLGAIVALSSTTVVLRILARRAELDSVHGRKALAVLLLQDVAVVPLVLMITILRGGESHASPFWLIGQELFGAAVLIVGYGLVNWVLLPRLLASDVIARNRELPVIFAIITALSAIWISHTLHLSPALGAFIAGALLGESPVATQIRADVGVLRVLFATLFFSSVGMLADPAWAMANAPLVIAVVAAIMLGKAMILWGIGAAMGVSHRQAVTTGICLAQVGEFSFVLAQVASSNGGQLKPDGFALVVSVTVVTLMLSPLLISQATYIGQIVERGLRSLRLARGPMPSSEPASHRGYENHIILVGFGPAGQQVANALREHAPIVVIELNPRSAAKASNDGLPVLLADATSADVLEHLNIRDACAVVVTLPDHRAAVHVIRQVRAISPGTPIIARARYQQYVPELENAGADSLVNEEVWVGKRLGVKVRRTLLERDATT